MISLWALVVVFLWALILAPALLHRRSYGKTHRALTMSYFCASLAVVATLVVYLEGVTETAFYWSVPPAALAGMFLGSSTDRRWVPENWHD